MTLTGRNATGKHHGALFHKRSHGIAVGPPLPPEGARAGENDDDEGNGDGSVTFDRKEYGRKYRAQHRDAIAARKRMYYQANRERIAAQAKAWRQSNREAASARDKRHRERHKEGIAAYLKGYRQKNRERLDAYYGEWKEGRRIA